MTKRFKRGLVVGKFAPLHRGHQLLIERALEDSDEVVIISYCNPEFHRFGPSLRHSWLTKLFPQARVLVVTNDKSELLLADGVVFADVPTNEADPTFHRRFCGIICWKLLGVTVDAVFTSEDYGDGFAKELTNYFRERDGQAQEVQHVLVDKDRRIAPISASRLREDLHGNRLCLDSQVYASFVQRICILGGESSGKSTLTKQLALEFETQYVPEFGRELWEKKNGMLSYDDMLTIARRQICLEDEAARRANRFLFCDTSPLTTLFYSKYLFGRAEPELELLANRRYDKVILCVPDFPFVQDGTRQPASFRTEQHEWYLRELDDRGINFLLAEKSVNERLQMVRRVLDHVGQPKVATG